MTKHSSSIEFLIIQIVRDARQLVLLPNSYNYVAFGSMSCALNHDNALITSG